jgi:predicted nucleic acid-binding protein
LANIKNIYWDTCVWLTLINGEEGSNRCEYLIECARKGELQIWTSSLSLAEAYKFKCNGDDKQLEADKDVKFEEFIEQNFVTEVQVDHDIGVMSRRLCRLYSKLKKPNDGIHLASAIFFNIDEFHTFDHENLIPLNGSIKRRDGELLLICEPPAIPPLPTTNQLAIELQPRQ